MCHSVKTLTGSKYIINLIMITQQSYYMITMRSDQSKIADWGSLHSILGLNSTCLVTRIRYNPIQMRLTSEFDMLFTLYETKGLMKLV